MNTPQVKIDSLQVNIKLPEQLHVVRPHSARRSSHSSDSQIPPTIKQQTIAKQGDSVITSGHKIRHIESIEDKGEFVDENSQKRISDTEQPRETIIRTIYPEPELPLENIELQKIAEEGINEEENSKPLKHINLSNIYDKDEFNLANSREKDSSRSRRLSQTNVKGYLQQNIHYPVIEKLKELERSIPEKVIEQQNQMSQLSEHNKEAPIHRRRKSSLHAKHDGLSQQINRMIVDELDKKKKTKTEDQQQQEKQQNSMEAITEEKQQDDNQNILHLGKAREKIQERIQELSKVVGGEIGPGDLDRQPFMKKSQTIEQVQNDIEE